MVNEPQIIIEKKQYPDHLELDFGGTRKGAKVYVDASNKAEAKERITNMREIAQHAENELQEFNRDPKGEANE